MLTQLKQCWSDILLNLQETYSVSDIALRTFLLPLSIAGVDESRRIVVLYVPDGTGFVKIIEKKYVHLLQVSIKEVTGIECSVVLTTKPDYDMRDEDERLHMSASTRKILDFHTHPYLRQEENLCHYSDDFKLSPQEAKEDLLRAGITKICGSVISKARYNPEGGFEQIKALNDRALELKALYGEFYEPGFHIHPAFVKESLEVIEFMHENGYRLIGEVVPYMHGWSQADLSYGSRELREILELAGEYGMVFSYHTIVGWHQEMDEMIAQNPKVTFVAAHPNERANFLQHLDTLAKYDNAYLDISGAGLYRYGMLREGIRRVGDEKFLFGTDYPITNPGMYVQAVLFEQISDESKERILYQNAERILFR